MEAKVDPLSSDKIIVVGVKRFGQFVGLNNLITIENDSRAENYLKYETNKLSLLSENDT